MIIYGFYFIKILENNKRCECLVADSKNIEKIICNRMYIYIYTMYDSTMKSGITSIRIRVYRNIGDTFVLGLNTLEFS